MKPGHINFARIHVDLVCDADATRRTFTGIRAAMTVAHAEERAAAADAHDRAARQEERWAQDELAATRSHT